VDKTASAVTALMPEVIHHSTCPIPDCQSGFRINNNAGFSTHRVDFFEGNQIQTGVMG